MKDCWINPNGDIIEVGDCQHNSYAFEFLEKEMGGLESVEVYMEENHHRSATDALHGMGWVRVKYNVAYLPKIEILGSCIDWTKPARNTIDPAMNYKQLKVAKKLCEENDTSFHNAVNDKRFW